MLTSIFFVCFCLSSTSLQLPVVAFNVNNLPFTEPMLSIWAQLVNLAGSKIEKHRMKSPNQGLSGTSFFFFSFAFFAFIFFLKGSIFSGKNTVNSKHILKKFL